MDRIGKLLVGILVLALVAQSLRLVLTFIEPSTPTISSINEILEAPSVSAPDLLRIQNGNLFGSTETQPPAPKKEAPKPQVKSRLAVNLLGVAKGTEPDAAVAILQERNHQRAYSVGDKLEIDSRAELIEIQADRVVLEVVGERQYVELEPINDTQWLTPAAPSNVELPQRISLDSPGVTSLIGKDLVKFVSDPATFGRFAQLRPNVVNGRLNGYRLLPGSDTRLFQQLGLQSGDLIRHVAGIDITDPENMSQLVDLVQSERWIKVGIGRGDSVKDIEVDLGAR